MYQHTIAWYQGEILEAWFIVGGRASLSSDEFRLFATPRAEGQLYQRFSRLDHVEFTHAKVR